MSDFGQSTPEGERVQFSQDGAAHVVIERKDTGAGRTHCNRRWLRSNQPREAHPEARTCVPCRRAYFGQPRRQHKTGPTIGVNPGSTAPKGARKARRLSWLERFYGEGHQDQQRQEPPLPAKHQHRQPKGERPGFGQWLRSKLPRFLKRGRGG